MATTRFSAPLVQTWVLCVTFALHLGTSETIPADSSDGLIAHFPLDEEAGTVAGDLVAGAEGTLRGFDFAPGSGWTEGKISGGLAFDGIDDFVSTAVMPPLGNAPRTITLWARTSESTRVMSASSYGGDIFGFGVAFRTDFNLGSCPSSVNTDLHNGAIYYSTTFKTDVWHFYAWVVPEGATQIEQIQIYADGLLLEAVCGTCCGSSAPINTSPESPLHLGNNWAAGAFFHGVLDEVRVYDRGFSEAEIRELYESYLSTPFRRGDSDSGGALNLTDAVFTLSYLFQAGPAPGCLDAADADDNGRVQITDAVFTLNHLFLGGPALPAPGGTCGIDPTKDSLDCREFSGCAAGSFVARLPGNVPLEMAWCPPGTFLMGAYPGEQDIDGDEVPQHQVTLTRGFHLGKYEVTKRQWQAVMGTTPWVGQPDVLDDPDSPAVYVSWDDAQAFIAGVNSLGQGTFRLPTEAEREYACRAGTTTRFHWGDDPTYAQVGDYEWYIGNAGNVGQAYAHVVGLKLPNPWGLYDMNGNVEEWCQDWFSQEYPSEAVTDPVGPPSGVLRVLRCAGWFSPPNYCRSDDRGANEPSFRNAGQGFRVARQ